MRRSDTPSFRSISSYSPGLTPDKRNPPDASLIAVETRTPSESTTITSTPSTAETASETVPRIHPVSDCAFAEKQLRRIRTNKLIQRMKPFFRDVEGGIVTP